MCIILKRIKSYIKKFFFMSPILFILIIFFILSLFIVPSFITAMNIKSIIVQASSLAVVASGVTFVVLNGSIDFSCTSIIALGSVIGASIITSDGGVLVGSIYGIPLAIIIVLLIGILFGIINGLSVIFLKMPSFIATLATMMIGSGLAVWFSKAQTIFNLPDSFNYIGSGSILHVPIIVLISVLAVLILDFILSRTIIGRRIYAVGTNQRASYISGIPVKKTIMIVFIISGICSSITCVLLMARLQSGAAGLGDNMFLDIIASIIIGGTSILGGSGKVSGTIVGAIFLTMMDNSLNMLGVPWFVVSIVKGVIIIIAAIFSVIKR